MARSVRRALAGLAICIPLAGCTTTQHEAQRVQLESARQRAALESTRVTVTNPLVRPTAISQVQAAGRTAFIVTVRNGSRRAVTDLPISVGYARAGGPSTYLNAGVNLNYFQAHLPAIKAGRSLVWVYTTERTMPPGVRPFARIGLKPAAPARLTEMNVGVRLGYSDRAGLNSLSIHLYNSTSVPQYQFQVYAYAIRGERYVAAGNATVADLGAGSRMHLRLALVGYATGNLHVEAIPTILQ